MSPLNCQLCQIHSVHTGLYRLWLRRVDHLYWFKEWAALATTMSEFTEHAYAEYWTRCDVTKPAFSSESDYRGSNSAQWSWTTGTKRKTPFWAERNRFGEPAPGSWYCGPRLTGTLMEMSHCFSPLWRAKMATMREVLLLPQLINERLGAQSMTNCQTQFPKANMFLWRYNVKEEEKGL